KFDAKGNLNNWWTPADRAAFEARAKLLSSQYSAYEPLPGRHIVGDLVLGESIADGVGAVIAFKAYHLSLGAEPAPVIDGYTGDQRFFLGYAQAWRAKSKEEYVRDGLVSDPHPPEQYRVIGVTRNLDAWYEAFGVKAGSKYYLPPAKRVHM